MLKKKSSIVRVELTMFCSYHHHPALYCIPKWESMWLCFVSAFLQAHSLSLDFDVVHILWPQSTLIQSTVIEENYLLDDKIGRQVITI